MKITHVTAVLIGMSFVASLTICAYATDPRTFFETERAAVGGEAWRHVAAVRFSGKIIAGDAPGSFAEIIDHRNGHSLTVTDTGSLHDESGFDGAIWDKQNGIVTLANLPSLLADAETQAFANRDGWWSGADIAEMKLLAAQIVAGSPVDGVAVTPAKGSPIDVWFDRKTHLIVRLVAHTDDGEVTTIYSDWRQTGGVRLPFRQVQTDSSGAVTTLELSSATVEEKLAADALARPAAEPHGSITEGASTSIPFRLTGGGVGGHILVAAIINGKPSNILFDSGAANYFVPEAAHRFNLVTTGGVNIGGVGTGTETGGFARVNEISIGAARLRDEAVIVGPLPYVATHPLAGVVVDGLTGFEFLSEFRTTIDYANRRLTFASFDDRTPLSGVTVPFDSDGHNVYVEATVDGATGWFRLDTGDRGTLSVFRTFADRHHLFQTGGQTKLSSGGVGGTLPTHEFRDETFALAGTTFTHVPVSVSDTHVGSFASESLAGNLGTGILSRFSITFDYRAGTLTFLPNPHTDAPFRSDRSGLSVTQNNAREIIVLSVLAGSQAEAAGVLAKDAIIAVNGVSVADGRLGVFDLDPLRYGTKAFELTIRRGDRVLTIRITPKDAE
jgi:predicted aspartyl protease